MDESKVLPGRVFRAKKPKSVNGCFDDMRVIGILRGHPVCHRIADGQGAGFESVAMSDFVKWAGSDITESFVRRGSVAEKFKPKSTVKNVRVAAND